MPEMPKAASSPKASKHTTDETRRLELRPKAGRPDLDHPNPSARPFPSTGRPLRSKGKSKNDQVSEKKNSFQSETPLERLRKRGKVQGAEKKNKSEAWMLEKDFGAKIYQVTAYTTVEKIEKKFRTEERQAALRKVIGTLLIILTILILLSKFIGLGGKLDLNKIEGGSNPPSFVQEETSQTE